MSSNVNVGEDIVRLQVLYGDAVENYFNDAPVDVGIRTNFADPIRPVLGEALPALGLVAFLDHSWSPRWSSAVGYSRVHITNSDGQTPRAFKTGQYAVANLLSAPVKNVMMGGEFQWSRRDNFTDGFTFSDFRLQFSFRYSFSVSLGG